MILSLQGYEYTWPCKLLLEYLTEQVEQVGMAKQEMYSQSQNVTTCTHICMNISTYYSTYHLHLYFISFLQPVSIVAIVNHSERCTFL